jgi:hypothetical protein
MLFYVMSNNIKFRRRLWKESERGITCANVLLSIADRYLLIQLLFFNIDLNMLVFHQNYTLSNHARINKTQIVVTSSFIHLDLTPTTGTSSIRDLTVMPWSLHDIFYNCLVVGKVTVTPVLSCVN